MRFVLLFACTLFIQQGFSQNTWTETGGPFGGRIEKLKRTSDGTLYAVINQRLHTSTNNGDTWSQVVTTTTTDLYLNDLVVDVNGQMFAVYWSYLYVSTDGIDWTLTSNNQFQGGIGIEKVGPDNVIVTWGYNGAFVSTDDGVTWTQISTEQYSGEPGLWANSAGDIFYAVLDGKLFRHTYQGLTNNWSSSNMTELTNFTTLANGVSISGGTIDNSGILYISNFDDVYKSTDNGDNFSAISGNLSAVGLDYYEGAMATSPDNSIYYFAHNNNLYKSSDQGANWASTTGPSKDYGSRVRRVVFATASTIFVGTEADGVFRTTDTASSWEFKSNGLKGANTEGIVIANSTNKFFLTKNASSYWSSTDEGDTWDIEVSTDYLRAAVKHSNGTILLYGSKVFRSTDNGMNFSDDGNYYYHNKIIEASNGDFYGFSYGKIAKSTDQGASWTDLTLTGFPSTFSPEKAAIDDANNILCHGYDGNVGGNRAYKVVGTIASEVSIPNTDYINNLFELNNKFYMAQYENYYYTSDLGDNWTTVGFSGDKVFPLEDVSYTGVAVSKNGNLSITQDDGGSWNSTNTPSNAFITDIAVDASGDFYASANGSSVLKYTNELLVDPATLPPYIDFDWQPLNGPYGGRTSRIEIHPNGNNFFSITSNLLWKYNNGIWNRLDISSLNGIVYDVDIDASGSVYIIPEVNPQQKVYKSTDLGVSWTPLASAGLPVSSSEIRDIEVLSDGSILAFGFNGIYKSADGGATFTERHSNTDAFYGITALNYSRQPIVNPTAPGIVAAFGNVAEGMVVSTDFGTTWTVKSTAVAADPSTGYVGSYMYDKDGNILMHAILDVSLTPWSAEIWKSSDNGTSWTALATPSPVIPGSGNFYSKRIITLGTGEYIMNIQSLFDSYRSTDGGQTWSLTGNVGDVFIWSATQGSTSYILGSGTAGILKTVDGGQTFTPFSEGIPPPNATEIKLLNNKDMLIGATRPYYSSDFGQTFELATLEPAAQYLEVGDSLIGYGSRLLLNSKDGGKTWTSFGTDRYFTFLTTDATGLGFYGSDGTVLSYSTDLYSWTDIELSGMPSSYYIERMIIDQGGVTFAVVYNFTTGINDVYKIVFGSATKISTLIGTTQPVSIRYVDDRIYLYDSRGVIYKSTDGEIWSQSSAPAGDALITANDYLFIPTSNGGLWLSRNDGSSWQNVGEITTTYPAPIFRDIVINEYDGYAYATLSNSVAKKSGNIVITDDGIAPSMVSLSPITDATNVKPLPDLTITFDEVTNKVPGKKIRIFDQQQPALPILVLDAGDAVQNLKSFTVTPTSELSYLKTYFVVIDAGAFVDIFGNEFVGISSQTAWRFTIEEEPDTQIPVLTPVTVDFTLTKGTARQFEITVTDNKGLPTDKTKIFYRGISTLATTAFSSANMTVSAGSGTTSSTFVVEAQDQWYDGMGMEFYFESNDEAGNTGRSPSSPETYNYSFIDYPAEANPVITSGRISFGGQANNYRVISVPFDLQDPQVLAILNELGGVDKTKWRMYTYAGNEQFTENPTSFERGKGYWINVRNSPGNIQIEGASTPENNRTNFFSIELDPGWNQIGNPYPVDISWEQVRAAHTATVGAVKVYDGSTYSDGDILSPYQGGFVFVTEPATLTLKVRFKGITTGGRKNENFSTNLSESNWFLPISITTNEIVNALGGFGMHEKAKLDWDEFDDLNPPRFLDYAEVAFDREQIFNLPFAQDVVPTQDEFIWDFNAISSGEVTTINWDNSLLSGNEDLILFDVQLQKIIDMKEYNSYSFNTDNSVFKIFYGTDMKEKVKPTEATLSAPFPNPMSTFSSVHYSIPDGKAPYRVSLEVYNSIGQRVAMLKNEVMESGFYTADWDAKNNPKGMYFYRLTIFEKGVSTILTEKVILNR